MAWNPVAGATRYALGITRPNGRSLVSSTDATTKTMRFQEPGRYCVKVLAMGDRYSDYSSERCATLSATRPLPTPATPTVELQPGTDTVIGSWSQIPNVTSYAVRWTDDSERFGPSSGATATATSQADLGPTRSGQICLQVKARGSGDYHNSGWSPAKCLQVAATRPLPEPTVRSIT
jgi:hypothetical protein